VEFRVLGPADVGHMRSMLSMFGRAFEDPDTYDSARPTDEYLADLLGSPGFIAVAAVHDGCVVGGLAAYVLTKFEQARSEIYIYDLAVDESFRRRGVARGLIDKLRGVAADRGVGVIYVQADRGDDPAVALYSTFGAGEEVLHFDIAPHRGGRPDAGPGTAPDPNA
jgi:ribosomal protein S18 acetylase RimI-like enzyme